MDYTLLLWVAAVPAVLLGQIYLLGRRMSHPEKIMHPTTGGPSELQQRTISGYQDWLRSEGLEFRTSFKFGFIQVVVFQQGQLPRFFSFLFHKEVTFGAESYLEDLTILDTSNSSTLGMFPRPGAYAQNFPKAPAQEVWRRHLDGEEHLSRKFGFRWVPIAKSYEELFMAAVRVRMKHNRSQLFWPVRVLYRYFVTRHLTTNRPIATQFP